MMTRRTLLSTIAACLGAAGGPPPVLQPHKTTISLISQQMQDTEQQFLEYLDSQMHTANLVAKARERGYRWRV